jgi:hypothetical protein
MENNNKLGDFEVTIPYKSAGNAIQQKPVKFEVFNEDGKFIAHPLLNEDERRIANLPDFLNFTYKNGLAESNRGKQDGTLHVIESLVVVLKEKNWI